MVRSFPVVGEVLIFCKVSGKITKKIFIEVLCRGYCNITILYDSNSHILFLTALFLYRKTWFWSLWASCCSMYSWYACGHPCYDYFSTFTEKLYSMACSNECLCGSHGSSCSEFHGFSIHIFYLRGYETDWLLWMKLYFCIFCLTACFHNARDLVPYLEELLNTVFFPWPLHHGNLHWKGNCSFPLVFLLYCTWWGIWHCIIQYH